MRKDRQRSPGRNRRYRVILSSLLFATGLWAYLAVVDIQSPHASERTATNAASHYFWPHTLEQYPSGIATRSETLLPDSR